MLARGSVNELGNDAEPVISFAYATFQDVAYPHLAANVLHFGTLAFVGEGRGTRDDKQTGEPGEGCGNLLGHAIAEILLPGIAAEIDEWQDDNRGFVGERQRRWHGVRTEG